MRQRFSASSACTALLVALATGGCGAAPAPVAAPVQPRAPLPPEPVPRAFIEHIPPDVDGVVRWDFARIRRWPHADRFLGTYRRQLGPLACQVDVYQRAEAGLSAIWLTGARGFVLMLRGDLQEGDERCFPGGDGALGRVGRFEVRADEYGAVSRVADDTLIYGNPERVTHVLSWLDRDDRQPHRDALQAQMRLAEFGQHPLSAAFALRDPGHLAEGAATLHGLVHTCDTAGQGCAAGEPGALDARATVGFVQASAAARVLGDIDRVRSMTLVRLMLGGLLQAFDVRQEDASLVATLQLNDRDAAMVARQMPSMIRMGERLSRGR